MGSQNSFKIKAVDRNHSDFKRDEIWKEPFLFLQSADTQLGLIDEYFKNPNPNWEKEIKLTTDAIIAANQMTPKPKFFIVCGDLVNAMPGHKDRNAQIEDLNKCFAHLNSDIPLVCVCGNHDVGDTPTPQSIDDYRNRFGDDYFSFSCAGVLFIVLNSQYYENPTLVKDFADKQSQWLDSVLNEYKSKQYKHLVVFQHIPWFLKNPDEGKDYFNIEKQVRLQMLSKLYDSGVRYIFCGHYHRNAGGMYKDMELVVTSAIGAQLGTDKSGLRVVRVYEDSIKHQYYSIEDIPKHLEL